MKIKAHLKDGFEQELLSAALANSNDENNQLRANNFAYAMRSLLDTYLERVAPSDEIKKCSWYTPPTEEEVARGAREVNLAQKIKYAIQGGLSDNEDILEEFEVTETIKNLKKLHNKLSSYTHISASSLKRSKDEHEKDIKNFNGIMDEFFNSFDNLRKGILQEIDHTYVESVIQESFMEDYHQHLTDMGVGSVESSQIETHQVIKITAEDIIFRVEGIAYCDHHLGGKRDFVEISGSYPFKASFSMNLSNKNKISLAPNNFIFDTTSWYGEDVYGYRDA